MKNYKIIVIIGLFGLAATIQASRAGKVITTVGKTVGMASGIASVAGEGYSNNAEGENQSTFDVNATNFATSTPVPMYEKYIQSNTNKSYPQSPTTKNSRGKQFTPNTSSLNTIYTPDQTISKSGINLSTDQLPTATLHEQSTQQNSAANTSASNLDFFNLPQNIAQRYLQIKNLNKNFGTPQAQPAESVQPHPEAAPTQTPTPQQIFLGNENLTTQYQEPITHNQESAPSTEQTQNKPTEITQPAIIQPQRQATQSYDVNQIFIDQQIKTISQAIENWPYYHDEFTNEQAHDDMLQENILSSLGIKNGDEPLQVYDAQTDLKVIDALLETNKEDQNVVRVLNATAQTIMHQAMAQKVTPIQANSVVAFYFNTLPVAMRNDVFSFLKTEPSIDKNSNAITNVPSIEDITQAALKNPSAQAYKALQAMVEATKTAIDASQDDRSFFGNGPLLTQLNTFETMVTTTLKNPKLTAFQSWGTYASSFMPSTRTILNLPYIKNVKVSSVLDNGKDLIKTATPYAQSLYNVAGLTGSGDITLSQGAKKIGLIKSTDSAQPIAPKTKSLSEALNFDMSAKDINTIVTKNNGNQTIAQYYTPAMRNDIVALMGNKSNSRLLQSTPTVSDIINAALTTPSQQSVNALQSILKATKIAIVVASRRNSSASDIQQLQSFQQQITTALQDPKLMQFHSWTTQATSYAASFLPSVETVLNTTGLGKVTINQVINTAAAAPQATSKTISALGLQPVADAATLLAQGAINASGVNNITLAQAYDYAYPPATT